MRRQGNREFGVYMPPTGEDSVRRSAQVDLGLISRFNNVEPGRELGFQPPIIDPNQGSVERSNQIGIELVNRINNIGKDFGGIIRQGWGGNIPEPTPPTSAPTSTSMSAGGGVIRRVQLPSVQEDNCAYYVSWDAYVVLGEKWVNSYGGGYSVAGGHWMRLGEALIFPEGSRYQRLGYINDYFFYFAPMKLNPGSGGGFTLVGYGGKWGRPVGKTSADPDEFPFFAYWNPDNAGDGDATTISIRYNTPYAHQRPARCAPLIFSPVAPSLVFPGTASPPPPPPRNMCCDCNTIATIFAEQTNQLIAEKQKQLDAVRDHIDMRAVEQLQQINKMLQDMEINADLQPIIDEIKRAEANLWNGISEG